MDDETNNITDQRAMSPQSQGPGESAALYGNTSNHVSSTVQPSPVTHQQATASLADRKGPELAVFESSSENIDNLLKLDVSQDNENSVNTYFSDDHDMSSLYKSKETRRFDIGGNQDTVDNTVESTGPELSQESNSIESIIDGESVMDDIASDLTLGVCDMKDKEGSNSLDVNTDSSSTKSGLKDRNGEAASNDGQSSNTSKQICIPQGVDRVSLQDVIVQSESIRETHCSRNPEEREVQNDAMNISCQQSENVQTFQRNICEESSVPKFKTIPRRSGFPSVKPIPKPRSSKKKYDDLEAYSQDPEHAICIEQDYHTMPKDKDHQGEIEKVSVEFDKNDDCSKKEPEQTKIDTNGECLKNVIDQGSIEDEAFGNKTDADTTSLNEMGAVGGSPDENLQGILQKTSSDNSHKNIHRKTSAVQFNDKVTVETFSQTDPTSSLPTKAALAQGDCNSPGETKWFDIGGTHDTEDKTAENTGPELSQERYSIESKIDERSVMDDIAPDLSLGACDMKNKESSNSLDVNTDSAFTKSGLKDRNGDAAGIEENSSNTSKEIFIPQGVDGVSCQDVIVQSDTIHETPFSSNSEVRDVQNDAMNISCQQSENVQIFQRNVCEESSVPKFKTIPRTSGFPSVKPIPIPKPRTKKSEDLEAYSQDPEHVICIEQDNQTMPKDKDQQGEIEKDSVEFDKNDCSNKKPEQIQIDTFGECSMHVIDQGSIEDEANENKTDADTTSLNEMGAVGGSPDENVQGILQKTSPDQSHKNIYRKTSAVQFNDEVTVETFSQTDPTSSSTTKAALAQGDGPSPVASLRMSRITPLNESGFELAICRSPKSSMQQISKHQKTSPDRNRATAEIQAVTPESKHEESNLKRKDSIPKVLSPTDLLRRKQKALAAFFIKSTTSLPVVTADKSHPEKTDCSHELELKKMDQIVDIQAGKSETSNESGRTRSPSEDEFPLPFDSDISMPEIDKTSLESEETSFLDSHDFPFTEGSENRVTDAAFPLAAQSSDNNFILSGYDVAEYMIDSAEYEIENTYDTYRNVAESAESLSIPTLPELQQKILNENFQVINTYSASPKLPGEVSTREDADVVSGYDLSNTSPSKLNKKMLEREKTETNTPELGAFSYTSPSILHQKIIERENAEINVPGLGAFSYTSPSKLHQKIIERENAEINAPGLGAFSYISPSKLHQKIIDRENAEINAPGLGAFSYTSPSKLHQKIIERENAEINAPGLGAFSYISPSKLHQKIIEKENAEINAPGLGGFSYTSPSKLHQKIIERENAEINAPGRGGFSYTSPSNLHQKISERENADVNVPGLGTCCYTTSFELFEDSHEIDRDDNIVFTNKESPVPDDQIIENNSVIKDKLLISLMGKQSQTVDEIIDPSENSPDKELLRTELKEIEQIKEKARHWEKSCKRKERLDDLCKKTCEHSQSDLALEKVLSNESSCNCTGCNDNFDIEAETECVTDNSRDKQDMKENNIHQMITVDEYEDFQVEEDVIQSIIDNEINQEDQLTYINKILTNFVLYVNYKQKTEIPITGADCKKLMQIQALVTEVSKQNEEAILTEDSLQTGFAEDTGYVSILHQDSIIVNHIKHQLELVRNTLSDAYNSTESVDRKCYLGGKSVDSIKSGYLGESESNEINTEPVGDLMTAPAVCQKFFSENTGYHADVNVSDSQIVEELSISSSECLEDIAEEIDKGNSIVFTNEESLSPDDQMIENNSMNKVEYLISQIEKQSLTKDGIVESLENTPDEKMLKAGLKEIKQIQEKARHWEKRGKRRERSDDLCRKTEECSQSDPALDKLLFNLSSCSCFGCEDDLDTEAETGYVTANCSDKQHMKEKNIHQMRSVVDDKDVQFEEETKQEDQLAYVNRILSNFLLYIKYKQLTKVPMTDADCKELIQIQTLVTEVSKQNEEAKHTEGSLETGTAEDTDSVSVLHHKDSIIINKMEHQLKWARNTLSSTCNSIESNDNTSYLGGRSVDSIRSGYLGGSESDEKNIESFADFMTFPPMLQRFLKSHSEDTIHHTYINDSDSLSEQFLSGWMSSSESLKGAGQEIDKDDSIVSTSEDSPVQVHQAIVQIEKQNGTERDIIKSIENPLDKELVKIKLKENEQIKEKAKRWRKRCKRKYRLDDLCRKTQEHSQLDALHKTVSNASSFSYIDSKDNLASCSRSDKQQMKESSIFPVRSIVNDHQDAQGKKDVTPKRLYSGTNWEDQLVYVRGILTQFLSYIIYKQVAEIPITDADFEELILIQASVTEISLQNEETNHAEDSLQTGVAENKDSVSVLHPKDSFIINKMQHQLEWARNTLCNALNFMERVNDKSDLGGKSVDSIRSGYLGESESNEMITEPVTCIMTAHPIHQTLSKSLSEDTGYCADENDSDSHIDKSEELLNKWMFSSESIKGAELSLLKAELRHILEASGQIWQSGKETTQERDERKVTLQEFPEKVELQTRLTVQKGEEGETDKNASGCNESLHIDTPSTKSEVTSVEYSQRLTCLEYHEDAGEMESDIGPLYVTYDKEGWYSVADDTGMTDGSRQDLEGSPDRGQRLFGSSQNIDRRDGGVGKRKQASRSMTPDSRYMLDKEVTESQNRKLQTENATLQTENKLLKEKYNRAQAKISNLETQLAEVQEDLSVLQDNLNQEVSDLSTKTKQEINRDRDGLEAKILALSKENGALKLENASLEKRLESSHRATDMARYNSEKSRTLEAHKSEITSLKEEVNRVKALLEQSERHLREEEERHSSAGREIVKLTELKNALQQQSDSGGSAVYTDKQLKSLEKRLKVTEDLLHQERADRANNLSAVEDKLLTDNAKLQSSEKELGRQLHREKEKSRNFEQRVKQLREENEKLRLAMPFDDASLLSKKGNYDIPYSSHSNQRAETMKHISDDMNYILSQIEKQDGLQSRDDEEIIRTLWNKREIAYRQLQEYDVQFQELHINDSNIADGLKNLRDTYGQAESKLRSMEEQVEDARAQVSTLDATYQEQLGVLVQERHEAFARLKTAEDLLEAVRAENEVLHRSMSVSETFAGPRQPGDHSEKSIDAMRVELTSLESKVSQLTRSNQLMEAELTTIRVQLVARDNALKDVQTELDLAYSRLKGDDSEDRKQEKIDKLATQVSSLQMELMMLTDKYSSVSADNGKLESEISSLRKHAGSQKNKQQKSEQSESKAVQQLKDDIEERDSRLISLTRQFDDLENKLQRTRQDLYIEQMHSSELESENENLQLTVAQRAQMFEALSGTEREQLAQYQILKDTLDNVSQELAQKHAQIISLDVNLSGARDNCAELEEEVRRLRKTHGGEEQEQEAFTEDEQSSAHQLKIKELEKERAMLKQELEQAYSAIQASEEQYRTLQTESAQLEQELVKEKTVILQLTAEKGEIEQHLEELAEEHEALIQEKTLAEEDLIKLETKLQEILQKYENQARKQYSNFEQEYPGLPPEAKKLISELEALTLMLEGKEKEISMLTDKINRQNCEIDFLHHKVELVHNDSIANREDVARMISELTLKMKEAVSTREVNQFLVGERTKLQNEKSHLVKELDIERKNNDERKKEIQEVIRKIERTETNQKTTEKDSRNKDNVIISLESELRNTKHNMATMESEVTQLRTKNDHLNEDLKNLTGITSSQEKRLEMEQNSLSEEKSSASKWKEEFNALSHDFQVLEHEHAVLTDKLQAELQTVEKLKRELDMKEDENTTLKEDLNNSKVELDSHKGQLLITKDTVQKLNQDKGSIYQDYEGMCRSLTEKERQLTELRERTDEKMEHLKKEHMQERVRLEQDRTAAVQEAEVAKREMDNINEQLRQKEIQLNTFGKTLQELESVTREKRQLEAHVQKLESSTGDSKVLLDGHRKELMALNEALAKQQERTTRIEAENHILQADLKAQKESGNREARELNMTINELKSQHENERHYLNDNLTQTQTRLRSVETSLASAASDRDSVQAKARLLENTVEDVQSKLSDETTGRRLAEQSVGSLRLQLEDIKNNKNVAEARFVEMKSQLTKAEEKLNREEEKCQGLSTQLHELNAISSTNRSSVKAKLEQIEMLQKEVSNLKQMIETQKQTLNGRMKKTSLDFKQQIEGIEEERDKVKMLNQQLSSDLDSCREHIASKNKENLKLQEEILVLEDVVRECKVKQKHAEDTLRVENDKQAEQTARFEAQEEELKRLRNFLTKKIEQSGDSDKTMWHEMNRVIQELSQQMTSHLDSTRGGDKDRTPESLASRLRKQLAESQGELNTEKSLHQITKTSLHALDEDCQRLRKQLHHYRRRDPPSGEKKHKNRMEAINAIIARSQSQAHALLASGGFYDDSMISPRVRSHQASPQVGFHSPHRGESPDNSYSEDLSIASLPAMHYGHHSKQS